MTATAPITQDVLTIPRKLPEGPVNIVGLTREALRDALIAAGTPEKQARMRTGQIWQWVYFWGIRDFALMTNLAKDYRALLAERFVIEMPAGRLAPGLGRRHAQVPRPHRRRARGRNRLYSRGGPRHALHLLPGRLHADLLLLPHRHAEAGAQPDRRGDRRPDHARPRRSGRLAGPGEGMGERPRLLSNIVLMGMGEPLYNFDAVRDAMKIAMDGEGISLSRRRITLSTSGVVPEIARTATEIGCLLAVSASTPRPTRCATRWCRSTGSGTSPRFWRRCAPTRGCRIPSASPSNT
jgi:23S rRNA (adenine2503-C2)-methyltransferase